MKWERLGRIFDPAHQASWMDSHAALPVVIGIEKRRIQVVCSGRDSEGRGMIGLVEFDLSDPQGSTVVYPNPLLPLGPLGAFDDRGTLASSIVRAGDYTLLYYTGVMLGQTVPLYFNVGAARSKDAVAWEKVSRAPILALSEVDPFLTASPYVIQEDGRFKMWYVSGVRWELEDGRPKHYYHIRYAISNDGLSWKRDGIVCVDFKPGEYAFSRPSVMRDADMYRMWYAYRGEAYRIGYAESADGIRWERKDETFRFGGAAGEWESQMQCYPFVFDCSGERYMLYNGNDYGRTGFGLARFSD